MPKITNSSETTLGQLAVDIYQTNKEIIIVAPVAGVKPENIDIAVVDQILTIKGTRHFDREIDEENYFTKECFWGNFSRSVILPETADLSKITANFDNGVLEIHIPKNERIKNKIVRIKTK